MGAKAKRKPGPKRGIRNTWKPSTRYCEKHYGSYTGVKRPNAWCVECWRQYFATNPDRPVTTHELARILEIMEL